MKYRDDLEAAQHRIKELENQVADLKGTAAPQAPINPGAPLPVKKVKKVKGNVGCAFGGMGGLALFIFIIVMGGTRACVACNSDVTDPALLALNKCPAARAALGDDIGWSMVGCSNYKSRSGGDPVNGGCHSSASYNIPVSGSRARGTYSFSSSAPPGQSDRFSGGHLYVPGGRSISIRADGTCD